jgi:adenylate cyclase
MAIEIERKFLVAGEGWRSAVSRSAPMRQGYLNSIPDGGAEGRASIRVRVSGSDAWLNIKAAVLGSSRAEYEYPIPLADANEMLDRLCSGLIDKTRHYVEHHGHVWEVDEFAGDNAGLVVAEIELDRPDETFASPSWLGREVTDERRYYNHALALHPYRQWESAPARDQGT